jgi:hypothetical protein
MHSQSLKKNDIFTSRCEWDCGAGQRGKGVLHEVVAHPGYLVQPVSLELVGLKVVGISVLFEPPI